ncbi:MAG TPA: class I SAM-dependent methyltransferase [Rhodothermales bacterium]
MDILEYFTIVERYHTFQNPTSEAKLDRLIEYCGISDGQRTLDVGCGKGWLMQRIAERYAVEAEGVEVCGPFIEEGKERLGRTHLRGTVTFHEMPAQEYAGDKGAFDVGFCIGASFAIGTFEEAVEWLRRYVKPGGIMAIGDIYARHASIPAESAQHFGAGPVRSLSDTALHMDRNGMTLIGLIDSSLDEWDRYESLHWRTADEWARQNPTHPERCAFVGRTAHFKANHLRFDRDSLGWAIFVSRVDGG